MFRYVSSLAIIIFEVICCKIFFESFCFLKKDKNYYKQIIVIVAQVVGLFSCGLILSQWIVLKQLIIVLITTILMKMYLKISLKKSAILSMLYFGLVLLADFIVYIGNQVMFNREGEAQEEYILVGNLVIIFGKIILFICILLLKKQFGKKSAEVLTDFWWGKFMFFPIFTILTITVMITFFPHTENQMQADVLYAIALGMVIMNVFVYYLINDIANNEAKLHEREILQLQVKDELKMYHSISENYEKQKRQAHEFRNHILCMEALVREQKYEDLSEYITNISSKISIENNVIDTNHVIVNAVLNMKYHEAMSKDILFVFRVNDLSKMKIKNEDLVVLLANLLNNAIEACEKCNEKKVIKLKFLVTEENATVLSVRNTYTQPLIYENDELKTSKVNNPENHGVGIKNIVKIIEKYQGSYIIESNNQEFYFSTLLPEENFIQS